MQNSSKIIINTVVLLILIPLVALTQTGTKEELAAQYFKNGEYEKAAVLYEELYNKKPDTYYYSCFLNSLLKTENYKDAEKLIRKNIKQDPFSLKYYVDLGYVYGQSGNEQKAEKTYEDGISKLGPDREQVTDLANAFMMREQVDYALKTYEKGRKLLKNIYPFCMELAEIYEKKQDYENMINEYLNMIEFDPSYLTNVQNTLQMKLETDVNNKISTALKTTLLSRIQKNPSETFYSEMLLWYAIQQKDFESAFIQAKSLDRRFNEDGERIFKLAALSQSNGDYEVAIKAYKYIISKGRENYYYVDSKAGLLNAQFLKITNTFNYGQKELAELEKEYISTLDELGKNSETISLINDLAHLQGFYLNKEDDAVELLNTAISLNNVKPAIQAECKIELADIMLMKGEVWEATLLYSQVEKAFKNEPIGSQAKFKNAKLSYYIGEFGWAKAQLDVLKAATSKLIANDAMDLSLLISENIDVDSSTTALKIYARAELLEFQNKYDEALKTLDSISITISVHPISDEVLFKKADIKLKQGLFNEADSLLQKVVDYYTYDILADDALFLLAELNQYKFNDLNKAMELYQKILVDYPGSLYVVEARKRFRSLRGDVLN